MKVIPFSAEKHYEEISRWWKHHGWPVIGLDHLSDTGFLVTTEELGIPLCAGWLYFTGSAFAIFEWAVINPTCRDREMRKEAMTMLLDFMHNMAKQGGAKTIFTSAQRQNLAWISRLEKNGFTVTDSNMTNLVAKVGG